MRITRHAATLAAFGLVLTGCASEAGNQAAESTESAATVERSSSLPAPPWPS